LSFGKIDDKKLFRKISKKELSNKINNIQNEPITIWDQKIRFSLAGVQDKLAVIFKDDIFGLADGSSSSTHILKFDTDKFKYVTLNEYFCMNLAKKCDIEVANTSLLKIDNHNILVVERFDRKVYKNKIIKIHTIDGCQMLDLPSSYKYERNFGSNRDVKDIREGVSFKKLFEITNMLKIPAVAKLKLVRWALFNLIIANSDAHGKNISFFIDKNGYEITPFYDLLNISIYDNIEHSLAMAFGDEFDINNVLGYDLVDFAYNINLPKQLISKELKQIAKNILNNININFSLKLNQDELDFINKLKNIITNRAKKYLIIADEMLSVS
jgi:serine/threonine-protein kinase HipA